MPRVEMLVCDAPDCDEEGEEVLVSIDGRDFEVILGPAHLKQLREIAGWGRRVTEKKERPRRSRRGTEESRLESLIRP